MGAITTNVEATSKVPAQKMFQGVLDIDEIVPKILPQVIKSVQILEGDGGVGTIKEVTFGEAVKVKTMKQRIDAIDKEALTFSYTVIGGDILLGIVESISNQFTVVPTDDGGCIVKSVTTYTPIGDNVIPEENIKEATEQSDQLFKAVEAHLLAN